MPPRVEEVQRQHLALALGACRGALDGPPHLVMEDLATPEGKALVGDVPHEPAAEAEAAGRLAHEEVAQSLHRPCRDPDVVLLEQRVQRSLVDREAQHRRVAQRRAVGRVEPVDLAGDQCLDRLGKVGHRTRPAGVPHQCLEEHRVPAAALGEIRQCLRGHGMVVEGVLDEAAAQPPG